jgi:hypothetical protein
MSVLVDLTQWYAAQCDGEWEHVRGITIRSCDNPGWWVEIDLLGTALSERRFEASSEGVDEEGHPTAESWARFYVQNGVWHGAGDASRLEEIITRFVRWAQSLPSL